MRSYDEQRTRDPREELAAARRRRILRRRIAFLVVSALMAVVAAFFAGRASAAQSRQAASVQQQCLKKHGRKVVQYAPLDLGFTVIGYTKFARTWSQTVAICGHLAGVTFGRLRSMEVDGHMEELQSGSHQWVKLPGSHFLLSDRKDVGRRVVNFRFAYDQHVSMPGTIRIKFHAEWRTSNLAAQQFGQMTLTVGE